MAQYEKLRDKASQNLLVCIFVQNTITHKKMPSLKEVNLTKRDDIKLCHWFPKFPLYHCYQIWYKDWLKYENRMRLVRPLFCHLPTTTIGIISTLQNFRTKNNIPDICFKSLRKWKFYWWVDFRTYDGVSPFLEWIWQNPVFLSIGGEFMMSAHHMMGFHHMMCVLPIKW